MAIVANVKDGVLNYNYTDSSEKEPVGSDLGYDQFLQLLCAEMQYQDPLEPTSNTDYVAQLATFSQLEATLSLQETEKNDMANNLVGKQVILNITDSTTGKTSYVEGKVDYVLYQNGDILLSVNDNLYNINTLDTVADSGYYEAAALAKTFSNMLAQFPDKENITSKYQGALEDVREVYNSMTDYQKGFVKQDDLIKLNELENYVKELVAAEKAAAEKEAESEEADSDAADAVTE